MKAISIRKLLKFSARMRQTFIRKKPKNVFAYSGGGWIKENKLKSNVSMF